ncbi:hypothetical protein [Methylomonas koyamae]|nr:hypothetical protein [Methylomonas koyamae]
MSASKLGNSEIKLKGYDSQGDTIRGTNDDFSLSVDLLELPKKPEKAATVKYNQFMALAEAGVITLPAVPQNIIGKIKEIFGRL